MSFTFNEVCREIVAQLSGYRVRVMREGPKLRIHKIQHPGRLLLQAQPYCVVGETHTSSPRAIATQALLQFKAQSLWNEYAARQAKSKLLAIVGVVDPVEYREDGSVVVWLAAAEETADAE
jgi:hypothetical protein